MPHPTNWIVTADERRATLFGCRRTPSGRWHFEQERGIENRWENGHEHHRPSRLGRGASPSPSQPAAYGPASVGHEAEEERRRFARDVRAWLAEIVRETGIASLTLFTPPKFLGMLREELARSGPVLDMREGELAQLRAHELADHEAVHEALRGQCAAQAVRLS